MTLSQISQAPDCQDNQKQKEREGYKRAFHTGPLIIIVSLGLLLCSSWMAGSTIFKLGYTFIQMGFGRFSALMFVAVVAGVFGVGLGMAGLAGNLTFITMTKGEGVAG
jgi:hypothetical protein